VLARTLGLPPKVMERAQEYLGDKHSTLEQSIEVIQQYRRDAERMRRESEDLKSRAEKKKADYEARFAEFKTKYNELIRVAKQEAADIVSEANKVVENTIRELREASKEAEFIRETHERMTAEQTARKTAEQAAKPAPKNPQPKTLTDIKKAFDQQKQAIHQANAAVQASKATKPSPEEPVELSEGDAVLMEDGQTPGVIVTLDRASNSAVVEFDAVKFRTTLDKLTRASTKQVKEAAKGKSSAVEVNFNAETRLDLRGMYSDEALQVVEKSIAAALTGNVHTLTIVHGKGTGALRQAVQNHLANHPAVERYRNGLLTEGGAGVTVVDLK
jgi:DNA mismatch repair protein MutS2